LESFIVLSGYNTTPYDKLYGIKYPDWLDNLHTFGEIAIVHDGTNIQGKLHDKGLICMFVRYPPNHAGEVCQF
jgi:hypothetical protein